MEGERALEGRGSGGGEGGCGGGESGGGEWGWGGADNICCPAL